MNEVIKLTVGQAIVKFIDNQFLEYDSQEYKMVEGVFTIYGHGNVTGLGEALTNEKHSLKIYQGKNEQGMSHVALGYTKQHLRRKHIAVTSSVGPGSANIITAAATATANNLPLLIFPGDVFAVRQPDPVLQQMEFDHNYEQSTNDAFKAVSKYWDRINRPEQLMTALINGFRVLTDPANTGAVTICLPQDVQGETYEYPKEFFKKRMWKFERVIPPISSFEEAIELIKKSKKPLAIIGGGVAYSEAHLQVQQLANDFNIPFACTQAGKNAMKVDYYYNLGGIGVTGTKPANLIAKDADLIIGIGTKYSDFTTASKSLFSFNAKFININLSKKDAIKFDGLSLIGDAQSILEVLINKLKNINYMSAYKNEIKELQNEWQEIKQNIVDDKNILINNDQTNSIINEFKKVCPEALHQASVILQIQETIKKHSASSIIVSSAGSLPGDLQRLWDVSDFGTYNVEYGYSCMGYEIQAAIGAKMAAPDKEVFAFVGDGSFLMLHSEILTAIQENIKINILLFDNSGFGCIDNLQTSKAILSNATHFRKRNNNNILLDGEMMLVNYSQIAAGYGCQTFRIKKYNEIESTILESINQKILTLVEIKVLPKTMTDGFDAWWRVGLAQISNKQSIINESKEDLKKIKLIKKY